MSYSSITSVLVFTLLLAFQIRDIYADEKADGKLDKLYDEEKEKDESNFGIPCHKCGNGLPSANIRRLEPAPTL